MHDYRGDGTEGGRMEEGVRSEGVKAKCVGWQCRDGDGGGVFGSRERGKDMKGKMKRDPVDLSG